MDVSVGGSCPIADLCLLCSSSVLPPTTAHPPAPACAGLSLLLRGLSLAASCYGIYATFYMMMLGVKRRAINAKLWALFKAATESSWYRPPNCDLWVPVTPGFYISIEMLPVSAW